ncbi:MAG: restriction endonuclease subunit S [Olsenella sp.]
MSTIELDSICRYRTESVPVDSLPYVTTESMLPNKAGIAAKASEPISGKARLFQKGDTLVSNIRPYFKKIWQADCDGCCSADVLVFEPSNCDADYLYLLLSNDVFFSYMVSTVKGTKMPRGDKSAIMHYTLEYMNADEQRAIAGVLNPIRELIATNQRANDYLAEYLKSYAKRLYREYERDEGADLPEGWHWTNIDEISEMVCRSITPKYNDESDELILGQTCIRNNLVLLENGRLHAPKKITEKWLKKHDLLVNSTGVGSLGRTAQVWFDPSKLVVDSHVTIVRAADPRHALYMGFWAFEHERYIESLHTGSTGQTELPRDHVQAIRLVLPSDVELEKLNAVAQPVVELIVANQEESKRLAELRDTLLPKLMSGEIDVSSVAI